MPYLILSIAQGLILVTIELACAFFALFMWLVPPLVMWVLKKVDPNDHLIRFLGRAYRAIAPVVALWGITLVCIFGLHVAAGFVAELFYEPYSTQWLWQHREIFDIKIMWWDTLLNFKTHFFGGLKILFGWLIPIPNP